MQTSNTINSSLNLVPLDFDTLKNNFLEFLGSQAIFKGYNFNGSNFSVLIDLLVFNTFYNAWYLNMLSSEMFLDSCQQFDSGTSHAKELNYVPRSTQSAEFDTDIIINTGNTAQTSFFMPKFSSFYGRIGSNIYFFSTNTAITASSTNNIVTAANVHLYEGTVIQEAYNVDYSNTFQKFVISNANVDISSLSVIVSANNGSSNLIYLQANNLFNLNPNSQIYFIQCTTGGLYELVFGDGTIGMIPPDNSIIFATYRNSSADAPNGITAITPNGLIDGFSNVSFNIINTAYNGSPRETLESIKFNAPRSFEVQDRAVIPFDFATILQQNFPQIQAIYAYGGQTLTPPQYGKVFIAVKLQGITTLPSGSITSWTNFLAGKAVGGLTPVFINPTYVYLYIYSVVNYNINITSTDPSGIRTNVINAISNFSSNNLEDFNSNFYYSQFVTAISNADPSIISNETSVRMISYVQPVAYAAPIPKIIPPFTVNFGQSVSLDGIYSGVFTANGANVELSSVYTGIVTNVVSNGTSNVTVNNYIGVMRTYNTKTGIYSNVGNVNFTTGTATFSVGIINSNNVVKIYGVPETLDISATQNTILLINTSDVTIAVNQISN